MKMSRKSKTKQNKMRNKMDGKWQNDNSMNKINWKLGEIDKRKSKLTSNK